MKKSWRSYTVFLKSFDIPKLFLPFHWWLRGLLVCFLSWLWGVYQRFVVLFQVLLARPSLWCGRCACVSIKGRFSSPELVREATSCSVSPVEILTTLLEDALTLPLNFLFVTVVHYWLWTMSGWTHIVSPWGLDTGMRPFSFWLWGSVLITRSSPFGMGTTPVGASERFRPNWIGDETLMLAVTFFCSGRIFNTSASIRT